MTEISLENYFIQQRAPYIPPFYSIGKKKEDILEWFRNADSRMREYTADLFREQKDNWTFVFGKRFGIGGVSSPYIAAYSSVADQYAQPDDIHVNEVYRILRSQVSLVTSNELVPDVLPSTDEYSSRVACNVTKEWLQSMNYDMNLDMKRYEWEMFRKIFGECYIVPMWNPQKGDLVEKNDELNLDEIDYLDEEGNPIETPSGSRLKLSKNVRIGDIDIVTPLPFCVQIDPQSNFDDSLWFYWSEMKDTEYLKRKYKGIDWETSSDPYDSEYDTFSSMDKESPNRRRVYYFYHRSHEFLPQGKFMVLTKDHILVDEDLGLPSLIETQELPLVRLVDFEINSGYRGIPITMRNEKNLAVAYNTVYNQMYNNVEMESPKVMVHTSSRVDAQRMPAGISIFEWDGSIKPSFELPPSNSQALFNFLTLTKKTMDEVAFQTPMVRGDTPNAQMDSFIALQHFEDQRVQLASGDIKSHIKALEKLFRFEIAIARDKYHPDDKRLIKILGKHNTYQLKYFDPINLDKSYDVKISTTGNLANSKAARTQMIMTIKREFPDAISTDLFLDLLGMSHSQKFMSSITNAVASAESENSDMYSGRDVLDPTRYEDLITHWETHRIPMQTGDFKHSPQEIQEKFIYHVTATEKLMFDMANESPTFMARVQQLRQFPLFYTPTPVNEPAPMASPEIQPPLPAM